ncbi:hypothetical protein PQ689_11165 [Thermoanaerobacterium thermosaccharolyticum]|uniref:hypothetical protein n=1 Tax=Thermoanaerobacterium thermosaccharolyticum TaxID=1517 RepID=UPI003DA9F69A
MNVWVIEREKVGAYITDSIIWGGDVSIFPGKYIEDKMMRYQGQFAAEEVIKNLELNNQTELATCLIKMYSVRKTNDNQER